MSTYLIFPDNIDEGQGEFLTNRNETFLSDILNFI